MLIIYRPDTATYIQKIEREREAREKGKSSNGKSMLGKYVSVNLINLFQSWNIKFPIILFYYLPFFLKNT